MLWEIKNNKNATKMFSVYGQEVITERRDRNWILEFGSGDTSLRDESRQGCSSVLNEDA